MSCNDKKKFKTAEASSKASLRTKGAIDIYRNIVDGNLFRKLNKEWTADAKKRFDIIGNLFYEEDNKAIPNKEAFKKIDSQNNINYQVEDIPASTASTQTIEKVKLAATKMGIGMQTLTDYAKGNPSVSIKNVNGVADLVHGIIAIAQGKEDVTLTEEMVHIATGILEQTNPSVVTRLISQIDKFAIYKRTLDAYKGNKNYQLPNGKPDIRKIKKEAVDKLIAEVIIFQNEGSTEFPELMALETRTTIQGWWQNILDFIRGVYGKSNISIFEEAATQIMSAESGTVNDLQSTGGVYFQITDSVKESIDTLYEKYRDMNSRLVLQDANPDDRHYTYDGERVAKTVTEKIKTSKKGKFKKERTDAQKVLDEAKKMWGDEGHKFIEKYIVENLIDKQGNKKAFTSVPVSSNLSAALQIQLGQFAQGLISSYPAGTKFLIESKVVNFKEEGMLGSTVDFKAIYPVTAKDGTEQMKVDTLDWKFTSIDKTRETDIPWYKQEVWVPQMGEYVKIDRDNGVSTNQLGKTRMVPFILNYDSALSITGQQSTIPVSLEIGNLDVFKETNLYLLPVPSASETTGNSEVDDLVKSLQAYHEKLYKAPKGENKFAKDIRLNQLSAAIRNLQIKLNFAPLYTVAEEFLNSAKQTIDSLQNADYSTMTKGEIKAHLQNLLDYQKSGEKFASMDEVFLSQYPKESLTAENKKTLQRLKYATDSTKIMQNKIIDLMRIYAGQLAVKEGIVDNAESALKPEVAISGFSKTWEEASKLSAKLIKLVANLNINAGSLVNIAYAKQMDTFGKLLVPLEEEASKIGKKAFDLIGTMSETGLNLIKKLDPKFYKDVSDAKENKNKQFFLDNINKTEYKRLANELFLANSTTIENTTFSADEEENESIKEYRLKNLRNEIFIDLPTFNGYDSYYFNELFKQTIIEEPHYSPEYKTLKGREHALNMWEYFTNLNEKAKEIGYFNKRDSSFFPLIEATILQKMGSASNVLSETADVFRGLYTTKINEEQGMSKIDPETGQPVRAIPKYFTRTDKEVRQLSTDLNRVGALWIKALLDYEKADSLEDTFKVLLEVEKAKGSLMLDENNQVIFDSSMNPKVNKNENKNADIMKVIAEDALYNLGQDLGTTFNKGITAFANKAGKTDEQKAKYSTNVKKTIHNLDTYTRAIAVGLKPLIAIANWFGNQFQMFINSGGVYTWGQFERNNARVTVGNISEIETGLLDLFVPLNDNITDEERRKIAKKQGISAYLSTWSFSDVMMITNAFPEKKLQLANALSFIENSTIVNGKIVNIRQFLKEKDRQTKYTLSEQDRKTLEDSFEARAAEMKKESLLTLAKIENNEVVIPGVSLEELAKFRTSIVEFGRKLNGQMNTDNKAGYRRDAIFSSFMMFKTWMPKLLGDRITDIDKNSQLGEWEYGRVRLFFKTWQQLGLGNISKMRDIISGTEEGLKILDEMLENKKREYFLKTGQELEITQEEFYDLVRKELSNEMKELGVLFSMMGIILTAKIVDPPEDESKITKNQYKFVLKMINKITDEITFYYSPVSFQSMTQGSILPSLGLISKAERVIMQVAKEFTEDHKKAHGLKAVISLVPILSQLQTEVLPYVAPEYAKEMGIKVTTQSRQ